MLRLLICRTVVGAGAKRRRHLHVHLASELGTDVLLRRLRRLLLRPSALGGIGDGLFSGFG